MIKDLTQVVGQVGENKYFRPFAGVVLGCFLIGAGYLGYTRYKTSVQEKAQKVLAEVLDEYSSAIYSGDTQELANVEDMIDQGYARSKSSTLAPVFLSYKSDIQARRGDLQQAQETLKEALALFGKNSPFYDFYDIKRMLLNIDATCGAVCSEQEPEALNELKAFAYDSQRNYREIALEQLVNYYTAVGKMEEAQEAQKELDKLTSQQSIDLTGSF